MMSSSTRKFWIASALVSAALGIATYLSMEPSWAMRFRVPFRTSKTRIYSYEGNDYPDAWPIPPLERVHMSLENTVHYAFDTAQGRSEWNTTLPSGGAVIHLGPNYRTFTVGMFHHIRCLGIIREYLDDLYSDKLTGSRSDARRRDVASHCMNDLRQMVLCNADLRLETVRAARGHGLTVPEVTHTCLDWEAVYSAAEENYKDFMIMQQGHNTS